MKLRVPALSVLSLTSICFVLVFTAFEPVYGQIYSFSNAMTGVPNSVDPHVLATNLTLGSGLSAGDCGGATQGFGADAWPTYSGNFSNLQTSNTNGDYIEFSITTNPGYEMTITGFTANARRDNPSMGDDDGPTQLRYAYSTDGWSSFTQNGSNLSPGSNSSCSNSGNTLLWVNFPTVIVSGTISFRLYGFNSGDNGTGDLYFRNVEVDGSVYIPCSPPEIPCTPLTIDFTGFGGNGFAPNPTGSQLCSYAWVLTGLDDGNGTLGGTHTSGGFAEGNTNGGESTGGVYSLNNGALWFQPTGNDITPGNLYLVLKNTTGQTLSSVDIAYDILVLNDQNRSNSFNFAYATGPEGLIPGPFTAVPALDYTSIASADALGIVTVPRTTTLTGLSLANYDCLYVRWNMSDVGGSGGSRDEFGLDNIVVSTANAMPPDIAKSPNTPTACEGETLTITVTTPGSGGLGACQDEYRYSTDGGSNWSAWSTIIPSFAAVAGINLVQSRRFCTVSCQSSVIEVSWSVGIAPTCNITSGPTTVCPNSTGHIYTATGGGTYQWSITGNGTIVPPDNTSSVTVDAGATGTYTVTVEVTDNGCTSTCSQTVNVEDITPPSISCPANITVNNDAGLCSAVVNYIAPVGLDNCPGETTMQTAGLASGATFPVGITTNTFTVTAANSQTTSCSFTVTVTDNEPPALTCSPVPPVPQTPDQCDAPVTVPTPGLSGFCTRNHALDFDGVDDYVSASHDPSLNLTGDASFEAWVYVKGPNAYNSPHSIFDKTEINDLANFRFFLLPDNRMGFWNGTTNVYSTTPVPTGQWVHLAWVLESGTMTFYENGVSIGTGSTTLGAVNNGPLTIGRDNNQVFPNQRNINMNLDEVRLWNIPRSQAEIQAAKDLEINASYPGLIAFYNFNEAIACCDNSGLTTLPDGMGANNGTLSNFSLAAGCASNWVPGAPALGDPLTLTNDVTGDCSSASGTYPVGMTTVTWTATGANGQTATCEQIVTVTDNELPTITCPAAISISPDPGTCEATNVNLGTPSVSDNCASITPTNNAPLAFSSGVTVVTWTANDGNGNEETCNQNVTLDAPDFDNDGVCDNADLDDDNDGILDVDECGFSALAQLGFENVTPIDDALSAANPDNNFLANYNFAGTDVDVLRGSPDFVADIPGTLWYVGAEGFSFAALQGKNSDIQDGANDALLFNIDAIELTNGGAVMNDLVTVSFLYAPAYNYDVNGRESDNDTKLGVWFGNGSYANFASLPGTLDDEVLVGPWVNAGTVMGSPTMPADSWKVYSNTFVWTGGDVHFAVTALNGGVLPGNYDDEYAFFDDLQLLIEASCADTDMDTYINSKDLDSDGDGCDDVLEAGHSDPDEDGILGTSPVTVNAQGLVVGQGGYTGNNPAVTDENSVFGCNQPPVAVCQDITVSADGSCEGTAVAADFDNGSSDPDVGDMITFSVSPTSPYPLGVTAVVLTVTDQDGLTSTCNATITVEDDTPPSITCPANINVNTDAGQCNAAVTVPVPTVGENCSFNHALEYDGMNDIVNLAPVTALENVQQLTLEAWVYLDAYDNFANVVGYSLAESNRILLLMGGPGYGGSNDIGVIVGNGAATGHWYTNADVLSLNTWHHIAFVYDGAQPIQADRYKAYVDGVLQALVPGTSGNGNIPTTTPSGSSGWTIGSNFNGRIDEVRIWDDVRTSGELISNMGTPQSGSASNLVAYYNFNEGIACCDNTGLTTLTDLAGSNDGTLQNFGLNTCNSNWVGGAPALGASFTIENDFNSTCDASDTYPLGLTTITWTTEDGNGTTNTCEQTVTVEDNELPSITCPANLTVNTPDNSCEATGVALGSPAVSDNCSTSVSNDASEPYALGNTTVTWMVSDGSNSKVCLQIVKVKPYVSPPGYYFDLNTCQSTPCPPGTYCPGGTTAGIPCPAGTSQGLSAQTTCVECLPGFFSGTVGATECTECPAGTFSNITAATTCTACPYGTGSMAAATSCTPLDPQEISVFGNGNQIANRAATVTVTDDTDFGTVNVGNMVTHTFTIYNIDNAFPLTLSGNPSVEIADRDASDFSVTLQPSTPIASGGSTTFTVKFQPTATGLRTAIVMIASDDFSENPFVFTINGTGL